MTDYLQLELDRGNYYEKMMVMVVNAVLEADTENEAIELANDMDDEDFDWTGFSNTQIVGVDSE